jgi:energy-coupling factor transporter ATP-binding protein EcfA2
MQAQTLAIETAGLTKQFGQHRAVDTLHLAIHTGSVFGFLRPNGADKTTTIRMLLGLIRPTTDTLVHKEQGNQSTCEIRAARFLRFLCFSGRLADGYFDFCSYCRSFHERSSLLDSQRLLEENVCSLTLRRSRDV